MANLYKISDLKLNREDKLYEIGYKQLDSILNGLQGGSVMCIGARPGMGKSMFINNIVINLLEKYNEPMLYISLELSSSLLGLSLGSVLAKKSVWDVRNDKNIRKDCLDSFNKKNYDLLISDDCYYIEDLEEILKENKGIKFIVIDYIQLLNSRVDGSFTDKYGDVLTKIKFLAKEYNLIVLLVSQLCRNVEHRVSQRPLLIDLKSSGCLEEISDVVLLLYRESYYNRDCKNDILEINVVKNRYGGVGTVLLDYDKNKSVYIDY